MSSLKQFNTRILVTTDLSARGIDASNVTLVVNYDVPWQSTTFLHRCGRAGRYGSRGVNITLASQGEEEDSLRKIVYRTGTQIRVLDPSDIPDLWKLKGPPDGLPLLEGLTCPDEEPERVYKKQQQSKKDDIEYTQVEEGCAVPAAPVSDHFDEDYYEDYGHETLEEEFRDYETNSEDCDYGYDDEGGSELLLPDDFIVQSFAAITGLALEGNSVMTFENAKSVVSDMINASQKRSKPFNGFLRNPANMNEILCVTDKFEKHTSVFSEGGLKAVMQNPTVADVYSSGGMEAVMKNSVAAATFNDGGFEALKQNPLSAADLKDELAFIDKLPAANGESEEVEAGTLADKVKHVLNLIEESRPDLASSMSMA